MEVLLNGVNKNHKVDTAGSMKIQDIMTREVVTVTEDTSITAVAQILHQHGLHAVPVVDDGGVLRGIVTETDFFVKDAATVYLPAYTEIIAQGFGLLKEDEAAFKALAQAKARDIMTPHPIFLLPDADIHDMISLIRMHHFKTFPVVDVKGILVGVVAIIDIMSTIGKQTRLEVV